VRFHPKNAYIALFFTSITMASSLDSKSMIIVESILIGYNVLMITTPNDELLE